MSLMGEAFRPRAVVLAAMAIGVAGCSSETSRFNDNPFASRSSEATGSVPGQTAPSGHVEQSQLAPPPGTSRPTTVASAPGTSGVAGGGRGLANYQPATGATDVTGSVQAPPARKPAESGHWTWDGGTAVTVVSGETIEIIARRHGVPASAVAQANSLPVTASLQPGQRLVIPRYSTVARPAAAPPVRTSAAPSAPAGVHVVAPGDTLSKLARLYNRPIAEIAKANNIEPHATLKIGERITIPGTRTSAVRDNGAKLPLAKASAKEPKTLAGQPKAPAGQKQQSSDQSQQAAVLTPAAETPSPTTGAVKATDPHPSFRWPVKGRVIAGYGPKPNGQQNDGINVSVPEGTPVKAAEDGVVAYAGNELKGYGNLVLVRHPNGYVTAYAHAKELMVKRGDPIKRGQVIATSGQTGNVDAPQLHFEVRKGPAPMDPMPLLSGG